MILARLLLTAIVATLLLGCGHMPQPAAKNKTVAKKTPPAATTPKKAPKLMPAEDNSTPSVDFTPPGLRPGAPPVETVETPAKPNTSGKKSSPQTAATGKLPAGKTRKSVSGVFEFWMPNNAGASDGFDFRSGDIQSKGLMWLSKDQDTMLGFAEVRLDGPATKEILQKTAEQSSAGEDPNVPWVATTFCGCDALERNEVVVDGDGGKWHSREIIFMDGDTIYQIEGSEPGDKQASEVINKLFTSCKRVAGAKTPAPKGRGNYYPSPVSREYEVWMPREPLDLGPGQIKYKGREGECWMGDTTDTDLTFWFAELDVGEKATLAIAQEVAKEYWRSTRGVSSREVKYAGLDAIEQTFVASEDELQVRYFIVAGNRIYLVAWMGKSQQSKLPDVTQFLASFRKKGAKNAPDAMKDIPGGPKTVPVPKDDE